MSRRKKNPILQRFEYAMYRAISAIAARGSDDSAVRWGSRLGSLSSRVLRGRAKLALKNLRATFPEKAKARSARSQPNAGGTSAASSCSTSACSA